jgi:hypothetical protein
MLRKNSEAKEPNKPHDKGTYMHLKPSSHFRAPFVSH